MKLAILILIIPLLSLSSIHCSETLAPPPSTNLLINGDFEVGADSSLAGWEGGEQGNVTFSTDVPPGDGKYSVRLRSGGTIVDLTTKIAAFPGTHTYQMSAWGKKGPQTQGGGKAWLALLRGDSVIVELSVSFPDTAWVSKSIGVPLSALPGDSIGVALRAFYAPTYIIGSSYFDRVMLEVE